jgi:hypothetical protein
MKRPYLFTLLMFLFVSGIYAQVREQATIAWISVPGSSAEPFLCVFGNTPQDVILIDGMLNLKQEVQTLTQRVEANPAEIFKQQMERLNVRLLNIHVIQRAAVEGTIVRHFLVFIYERVDGKYYLVATNDY